MLTQWHKKIKLFHKKYVLIPVNKKDHWYTVIIVNLPSLFECFTKRKDPSLLPAEEKPYILLLDPLVTAEENIDLIIRLYLECELKEAIGPAYELMVTNKSDLSQDAKCILDEDNLPHYQLIVDSPQEDPATAEHVRLRRVRTRVHGELRAEPTLHRRQAV